MKKLLLSLSLISAFFIANSFAQTKKVAVYTFYVMKQIGMNQFGPFAQYATKLADDPNFNMEPLLKSFHTQFFETYSKQFPFELLPENEVIDNEAYKAFVPVGGKILGLVKDPFNIPYPGYKVIQTTLLGHENEKSLLKIFNTDGVMKVFLEFELVKIGIAGMGVVKVNAIANIGLYNKDGEKVFVIREEAKSKNVSALVAGAPVMTPEKILPMCESALTELMADLQKDLPKMVKKSDAKL